MDIFIEYKINDNEGILEIQEFKIEDNIFKINYNTGILINVTNTEVIISIIGRKKVKIFNLVK